MQKKIHIWRPYTQHALAKPPLFIAKAKGAYLYPKSGKKIFDAISSWWVNIHGHAHPKIVAAISKQAQQLGHIIFAGFTHEPAEALSKQLLNCTPKILNKIFYSDNGSTAVEVALKMAIAYWFNQGEKRTKFIALEHAYHGDTFGGMAVSGRGLFSAPYEPLLFDVLRIPFPGEAGEKASLAVLDKILKEEKQNLAALILEPLVLGVGGMKMYSPGFLKQVADKCKQQGIFLICDEVMTGFGRTGTFFAFEQANIVPDFLCLSKGITGGLLPLGVTITTDTVFQAFCHHDRKKTFFHGHSYTGNPISCAAAVASLKIFSQEPVFSRIKKISEFHKQRLKSFEKYSEILATRQCGTIAAIEFCTAKPSYLADIGPKLYDFYLKQGVLLRPLGNVFYLLPPYCSKESDLECAYHAIEKSITKFF